MHTLKRLGIVPGLCSLGLFFTTLLPTAYAYAQTSTTVTVGQTPPPSTAPGIIITSIVGNSLPNYIELYNQSDSATNLKGWEVSILIHDDATNGCADVVADIGLPSAWLLSKKIRNTRKYIITPIRRRNVSVPY